MSFASKKPVIVVDTSTLLSACIHPNRKPAQALTWALRYGILIGSDETFAEAKDVLLRPKFEAWRAMNERILFVAGYFGALRMVPIETHVTDCRDANDDKFLSLALAGKADVILASDPDITVLHPYRGIPVLGVSEFLEKVS